MSRQNNSKELDCKVCGETVKGVGEDATAVTCWKCVTKGLSCGLTYSDIDDIHEDEIENNN